MRRLLDRIYCAAWKPTTGRPWTFQLRDWGRHHPLRVWPIAALVVAGFVAGQLLLPMTVGLWALPFVVFADFMAFVGGHLAWGWGPFTRSVEDIQRRKR